jgi:hypothetical protein
LLAERTFTDFVGKLPEWLWLVQVLSAVYCLHCVTPNSHVIANAGANQQLCLVGGSWPYFWWYILAMNSNRKLKFCQPVTAMNCLLCCEWSHFAQTNWQLLHMHNGVTNCHKQNMWWMFHCKSLVWIFTEWSCSVFFIGGSIYNSEILRNTQRQNISWISATS